NKKLLKELGLNGYLRYLQLQPNNEGRDYLLIREETLTDMTLDEVYDAAVKYYENYEKNYVMEKEELYDDLSVDELFQKAHEHREKQTDIDGDQG
ncbi:MAG TPA: hypothetical protein VFD03_03290, partial [Clostridia bacterium]|nr:hypothetical protein [Clostridia bacterium]